MKHLTFYALGLVLLGCTITYYSWLPLLILAAVNRDPLLVGWVLVAKCTELSLGQFKARMRQRMDAYNAEFSS